jgi:tetratricopeptide (TPR) repeat protein
VLAARIDRLPPEQKHLLQAGSVIGKDIPFALLGAVSGLSDETVRQSLAHLQATEFLYEARLFPRLEYTFKHTLTHEVTYGSLDQESRKALHAKTVEALEQLYGERVTEQAEALARHALLGEIWDKAVDYLREAGAKAYARAALVEAIERYEQALTLFPRLPTSVENTRRAIDVRLDLQRPLLLAGRLPQLLQLFHEAEPLARQLNDLSRLGRVLYRMGHCFYWDARYRAGVDYARQALNIAAAINDPEMRVLATYGLGLCHQALGEYRTAIDLFTQNVDGPDAELAKRLLAVTMATYVPCASLIGYSLALLGDFERALIYGGRAIEAADAFDHPFAQAMAYTLQASTLAYRGEFAHALPWCERAVSLCEAKGVLIWLPAAHSALGWALAGAERAAEGLPYLERGATLQEAMGLKTSLSRHYVVWGQGLLLAGQIEEAIRVADRAIEVAEASTERGNEAEALHVRGQVAAARESPDLEGARTFFERARSLAEERGMRPLLGRCHLGLGRLFQRSGDAAKAASHLQAAAGLFGEMGMQL